ncbi:hypothetical protein PAT3040_03992 [Paenibacillus agaridevorans]|uniref:Uncharacterized protein n=1 Tax=Paenibacillus agaridevorans TaxID=171404 RepID=A0A2R5EWC0_9BACL|nr:hypothetical protein [Paenibacillus agaridevorans]GBG09348.1 hypothetical protein PAT3040_03992 [Paenibacillus agaridevorans]
MQNRDETVRQLMKRAKQGTPLEELVQKEVIAEEGELILVRDMQVISFAEKLCVAVRYELWWSRALYEAGEYAPEDGTIPFTGYCIASEEDMLREFQAICMRRRSEVS